MRENEYYRLLNQAELFARKAVAYYYAGDKNLTNHYCEAALFKLRQADDIAEGVL
tara:strand:+ start:1457 stop:1621 length:165 start_codon:yes stop_codon:yes gene_type:complete